MCGNDGSMSEVVTAFLHLTSTELIQALDYLSIWATPSVSLFFGTLYQFFVFDTYHSIFMQVEEEDEDNKNDWAEEEQVMRHFDYHKEVHIGVYNYEEIDYLYFNENFNSLNPYVW